jgi:hypothetical protein
VLSYLEKPVYFKLAKDLQEEIARFSIQGYAETHFMAKKRWSLMGRKTIKNSDRHIVYTTKISTPLTIMATEVTKQALSLFQSIFKYMDRGSEDDIGRGREFLALVRDQDQLRYARRTENDMMSELYCQLIQQTTDNPHPSSLERGWELLCLLILSGLLPSTSLMNILIGHANLVRFESSATGAFALLLHSALCCHVAAMRDTGSHDASVMTHFPPLSDVSYEDHVVPLRNGYMAEKVR